MDRFDDVVGNGFLPESGDEHTAWMGEPAQVGVGGLAKVQWWAQRKDEPLPKDDEHFAEAPWQDAEILPLPDDWRGGAVLGALHPMQFDPESGEPCEWPMRYTRCHWVAKVAGLKAGDYVLRCRSIDLAGNAQPMPRPYKKSGRCQIDKREFTVA